ncbi:alpha-glucosidase [Alicyclobacillus kakegawensis]|uniref:alpha-glucosidase n=1 Tax=Alicyclobacillus kakegawensis TaxID=392012 RepID=UPI000833B177|nr:alpha-glucosidase [Alicyclobacillus kakegawensis]
MHLRVNGDQVVVAHRGRVLIRHQADKPWLCVGRGSATYDMHKGNFTIEDSLAEKVPLSKLEAYAEGLSDEVTSVRLVASGRGGVTVCADVSLDRHGDVVVVFSPCPQDASGTSVEAWNRWWIRVPSEPGEAVFGCGEQFSHLNLRGRRFPLWVSEQGVGRNKKTYETFLADTHEGAGGDYYTTYFPQPTFVSSQKYYFHVETSGYSVFDFRDKDAHQIEIWGAPPSVRIGVDETFAGVLERLTAYMGRQPELPEWVYDGVWLGLQGGTDVVDAKLRRARNAGVQVAAVWAQDWQGKRITPFGKQLMWNWRWDRNLYPNLDKAIPEWRRQGIRFLGYINCFLAIEGDLYEEAKKKGYLARNREGHPYHVVITSFPAAMVDLTNPNAVAWLKRLIQREMIDLGLSGWMADFGEYLPTDAVLYNGRAEELHNQWPTLWARVNREAVEEYGRLGRVIFFMRAGYSHSGKYTTMVWAGDQNVDWSRDDGLPSVIPSALSLGMSGVGLHHSDIGGYTTLFHIKRSKELFMRWAEQAAFTVLMRTHEGNRPDDNWQFDGDEETLRHFARMSQVHVALKPYLQHLVRENSQRGMPVVRPIFLHYENEPYWYDVQDAYLLGRDVLVAPVLQEQVVERKIRLPQDEWIHLWSGHSYHGGEVAVAAPLGEPPVFYRASSPYKELFESVRSVVSHPKKFLGR